METVDQRIQRLRAELDGLMTWHAGDKTQDLIDVVITTNEVNHRHGTGVLVKRVLDEPNLLSIRFHDDWGGPKFGEWNTRLPQIGLNRADAFHNVLRLLQGRRVRRALCVPYHAEELLTAIAIREAFDARVCGWVMDDQNVAASGIPDWLMRDFLECCSLRLTTHPELRTAYQQKYGMPFYLFPAVAPDALIPREALPAVTEARNSGALIGSFWDQSWFDRLCTALEPTGCSIAWFGNNRSPFVRFPPEQLLRARITPHGVVDEARLAKELRNYPFVLVPTGTLDVDETNTSVASLSLPGRIPFAAAVSQTPMLLVGSDKTCGAHFVRHFGIGEVVPYETEAIRAAMNRLSEADTQRKMRLNAEKIGAVFSDRGVVKWLADSIELGCAADSRFEEAFANYEADAR